MSAHIRTLIANSGVTKKFIYTNIGIGRETFDARLMNPYSFTYRDLIRMSDALRVPLASLTPAENHGLDRIAV